MRHHSHSPSVKTEQQNCDTRSSADGWPPEGTVSMFSKCRAIESTGHQALGEKITHSNSVLFKMLFIIIYMNKKNPISLLIFQFRCLLKKTQVKYFRIFTAFIIHLKGCCLHGRKFKKIKPLSQARTSTHDRQPESRLSCLNCRSCGGHTCSIHTNSISVPWPSLSPLPVVLIESLIFYHHKNRDMAQQAAFVFDGVFDRVMWFETETRSYLFGIISLRLLPRTRVRKKRSPQNLPGEENKERQGTHRCVMIWLFPLFHWHSQLPTELVRVVNQLCVRARSHTDDRSTKPHRAAPSPPSHPLFTEQAPCTFEVVVIFFFSSLCCA